ncbi:hypothetical protein OPV22_033633 [Ensete ventricosum]|uniref:Terpene synthase N-terminal domain-containing protein n=1 Tax=Ensete ventricosum TaxID=4639 RepID=A0AAV8Q014_ENSVE|nr:hypothetical protein OPV22_033633 [Ensete ventricosum]
MSLQILHVICAATCFPCSSSSTLGRIVAFQRHGDHASLSLRIGCSGQPPSRRSANYQTTIWTHDSIQSQTINHTMEEERVVKLIQEEKELEDQLQLIDHLQQLGVAYHFKDDIKDALGSIHGSLEEQSMLLKHNLHATALLFRLLRENGFDVSEDMFSRFKDGKGHLKACLQHQTKGMLSLYEASYLEKEGELVLSQAMDFTTKHLKKLMEQGSLEPPLREQVASALELPLHWRMHRLHARWFIEAYQRDATMNPLLLELAKLDFNMVQGVYKRELSEVSRWWTDIGLAKRLPFFRDRLVENYLWTVGWAFEPQFWSYREIQTKANCFITMIDDVYDVYGTLDELELFTDAVDRWDINAIDKFPEYMKMCFLAVFNLANDAAYGIMKEKNVDILPYLKRAWGDLCKTYLVEAKWYQLGHVPKLSDYLDNAWISISGHVSLTHAFCMTEDLTQEALESFRIYPEITRPSCMLLRLYNDLATSAAELQRGDVAKALQCCMHERDVSESAAREHVGDLIRANWRALNGNHPSNCFTTVASNTPRVSQFMYGNGDGYGIPDGETKNQVMALLIEPILF